MRRQFTSDYLSYDGFEWGLRPGLLPHVRGVVEARRHALLPHNRVLNAGWALDWFYTPARVKVGAESARWLNRKPRTAHLYPPMLPYWEDAPASERPVHHGWVQFNLTGVAALERLTENRFGFVAFQDPAGLVPRALRRMVAIGQEQGEEGFWRAQAILSELLDLLLNSEPVHGRERRITGRPSQDAMVAAVQDYIRNHLDQPVALEELARAAHVSVSTLTHRYARITDEAPMATLRRIRMVTVRDFFRRGGSVKEAAAMTGFSSSQHLSSEFKKETGVTPSTFIRDAIRSDAIITGRNVAD